MLRLSLLTWNPLEVNCKDLEKMEWYETVMRYGFKPDETEAQLLDDPDIRLVPTLIEKIVLPKITGDLIFQFFFSILYKLWNFLIPLPFFRIYRQSMGSVVFFANTSIGDIDTSHDRGVSIIETHIKIYAKFIHSNIGENENIPGQ